MPRLSPQQSNRARQGPETLHEFLARALPPGDANGVEYFTTALEEAGARYDRYAAKRDEWWNYADRKSRLKKITDLASALAANLCELDVLSRDDLARRADPKAIETLIGSLSLLGNEMASLVKRAQDNGAPRDLAEERWIVEVAEIYENAFGQSAGANRVVFCRLLELSRPSSLPRYGKLNPRQIKRALERRRWPNQATAVQRKLR